MHYLSIDTIDHADPFDLANEGAITTYLVPMKKGIAFDLGEGKLYIFSQFEDNVSFDSVSQRVAGFTFSVKPMLIKVRIIDLPTHKEKTFLEDGSVSFKRNTAIGPSLALQPGGQLVAASNHYDDLYIINVPKALSADKTDFAFWKSDAAFFKRISASSAFSATGLCWSPKGTLLAVSRGITVFLWKAGVVDNGETIHLEQLPSVQMTATCMDFSPDEQRLALGDKEIKVFDVKTRQLVAEAEAPSPLTSILFSPSGQYLLTGSKDRTLRLWKLPGADRESKLELVTQKRVSGQILQAGFYPPEEVVSVAWTGKDTIHTGRIALPYSINQDLWEPGDRQTVDEATYTHKMQAQETEVANRLKEGVSPDKTKNEVALLTGLEVVFPDACIGCGKKEGLEHPSGTLKKEVLKEAWLCPECRASAKRTNTLSVIGSVIFIAVIVGALLLDSVLFKNMLVSGIAGFVVAVLAVVGFMKLARPRDPLPGVSERSLHGIYRFNTPEAAQEFLRSNPSAFD